MILESDHYGKFFIFNIQFVYKSFSIKHVNKIFKKIIGAPRSSINRKRSVKSCQSETITTITNTTTATEKSMTYVEMMTTRTTATGNSNDFWL